MFLFTEKMVAFTTDFSVQKNDYFISLQILQTNILLHNYLTSHICEVYSVDLQRIFMM